MITPEAVIEALENPHDRMILARAQVAPVLAQDLIADTDIPRSTAYRRIERLKELGLLKVTGGAIKAGHAVERLGATVERAALAVHGGEVAATWRLAEAPDERLHRLWSMLR